MLSDGQQLGYGNQLGYGAQQMNYGGQQQMGYSGQQQMGYGGQQMDYGGQQMGQQSSYYTQGQSEWVMIRYYPAKLLMLSKEISWSTAILPPRPLGLRAIRVPDHDDRHRTRPQRRRVQPSTDVSRSMYWQIFVRTQIIASVGAVVLGEFNVWTELSRRFKENLKY